MKRIFRRVLSELETDGFIEKIQDCYFSFKNAALKGVQEAIEANNKKEFNRWHQRLKCFNASNDEIVQMMRKNERKLEDWEIEKMFSENISEWDKNGYDG
jgi:DNA-binding transcriptional regulator YhcF (GntR family)